MTSSPDSAAKAHRFDPAAHAPRPAESRSPEPSAKPPAEPPDPTRYGDWEKNGRCIDF